MAYAENELTVSAYLTPGDFVEPGPSTLTVLLHNPSEYTAQGVQLSPTEKQEGAQIGDIAPGESAKFEYEMTVSQKALNAGGVDVFVYCTLNGQRLRQQISAPVRQVAALAQAEFSRRASANMVRAGEEMQLTYTLRNVGEVGLENVVIFDSLDNYSFPAFALGAGEVWEQTRAVTVDSSAVSRVSASFTSALSGSQYYLYAEELAVSVRADDVRIAPEEEGLALPYVQPGLLRLEIENLGPYNYASLSLSEPTLGRVPFLPAALRAGEKFSVEVELPPRTEKTQYRFALNLRDEGGTACTVYAEPIEVDVLPARERPVGLTAVVTANTDHEGEMAFLLTLSTGAEALMNVEIGEKALGALRTLAVVPAADDIAIYLPCARTTDGEYTFYASFTGADGVARTLYAGTLTAAEEADAEAGGLRSLEAVVLVIVQKLHITRGVVYGCALLLVLIPVVVAIARRRNRRRRALRGATNKFVPVHAKNGTKEKE